MSQTSFVPPRDIITVDVEEWFHGHNYLDHMPPEVWDDQELRVEKGMSLCLDLLDRFGVKGTFFVLGWTAERHPDVVREIVRRGHEVGCHSYAHPEIFKLTRDQFRSDCDRALAALAAAGVDGPAGYRAPSFSITPSVHGYLEILRDCGFRYDCSIFPIHHPRYGQPDSPRRPFLLEGDGDPFTVVPMPTWRFLGVNLPFSGGGYLRLLPWWGFKFLRRRARRQGLPCLVYMHPWELDDFRPRVGQSTATSLRSQGGQTTMPLKISRILELGDFETLGEYVARLESSGDLPVTVLGTR
jgi:polysaccharide deacetylase family protein (PEP-CTERM system associated)